MKARDVFAGFGIRGARVAPRKKWTVGFSLAAALTAAIVVFALPAMSVAADPVLTINSSSEHSITSVKVSGTVTFDDEANGGTEGAWFFAYCHPESPGDCAASAPIGEAGWRGTGFNIIPAGSSVPVEETLSGLTSDTEYIIRLCAVSLVSGEGFYAPEADYLTVTTDPAVAPIPAVDPPGTVAATTAQLAGSIDPQGGNLDTLVGLLPISWELQYARASAPGNWKASNPTSENPLEGANAESTSPVPVTAEATGLVPATRYRYRLLAHYAGLTVATDEASWGEFTTPSIAPTVASGGTAVEIGSTAARVKGELNPGSSEASYRFEYGTTAAYGQWTTVGHLPPAMPPSESASRVSAQLNGLSPGTSYHWRLVIESAIGTAVGADHTFTTLAAGPASLQLPDNRAWEKVTPDDKNGSDLGQLGVIRAGFVPGLSETISGKEITGAQLQASTDGNRVNIRSTLAALEGANSVNTYTGDYISERGSEGWVTRNIDAARQPTGEIFNVPVFLLFSDSLSRALTIRPEDQPQFTPEAIEGVDGYYVREPNGTYRYLYGFEAQGYTRSELTTAAVATPDLTHIFQSYFTDREPKYQGSFAGKPFGLYESYQTANGGYATRLASVLPDGLPADGEAGGGAVGPRENSVSRDGERVVFTTPASAGQCVTGGSEVGPLPMPRFSCEEEATPQLYIRENGSTTRWISDYAPGVPTDPEAGAGQHYWGADTNVAHVFFTSQTKLTANSTASHDSGDGFTTGSFGDLYRYDVEANGGAGKLEDITVDHSQPEGAQVVGVLGNSDDGNRVYFVARSSHLDGEQGVEGQANLYLWDYNSGSPETTYIGTLRPADGSENGEQEDRANWIGNSYWRSSEVTPSGSHLLFTSKNALTGFATGGHNEVYVYNADTNHLMCASCFGDEPASRDAFVPIAAMMSHQPAASIHHHSLSDDGRWVFFNTKAALVAGDNNGQLDAYRFDTVSGTVALLSSGQSQKPSYFLAAGANGRDAFFVTHQQLVRSDTDQNSDVYDARVDGGIASQNQIPAVPCEGEACQPPATAPGTLTPGSASYVGPGTKKAAQKHHKKKHHKKKHHKKKHHKKRHHGKAGQGKHSQKHQGRHGKSTRRHG